MACLSAQQGTPIWPERLTYFANKARHVFQQPMPCFPSRLKVLIFKHKDMKHFFAFLVALVCTLVVFAGKGSEPVVVAYVTSWTRTMPDPTVMTHINYAFGHVNEQFNGVRIDNEKRLRDIVSLKKKNGNLRIMLSIGGWGSGRFSEMAADEANRKAFARDCRRLCDELGIDGIDIDWEYPTQNSAGISSSPKDTENFNLLMRDLRQALGKKLWLTLASVGSAQFIDFRGCVQYLDVVNVMAYDMGNAPKHHSALYRSPNVGWLCASEAVEAHRKAGVPYSKMVLGMPFYGRGEKGKYMDYKDRFAQTDAERWDAVAKASYLADRNGKLTMGFDSPRSIAEKCAYIHRKGLRGAMYWEYSDDNQQGDLQRAVWQGIMQSDKDRSKACRKSTLRLVAVLKDNQKREDITPDSFFHDWRQLKGEMLQEKDPTAQAIYRAAMARLLCQNQWRSQRYDSQTTSHPDSIQEWSQQEYLSHAANLYAQALQNAEVLHRCKLADAKPLVQQGKDNAIFNDDLLYIIWQSAKQDLPLQLREKHLLPNVGDIIEVYRRHNLREATLLLRLDSILENYSEKQEEALLRLRNEYADISACAQVYLQLASLPDKTDQEQQELLQDALKHYPKSRQANELRNRLISLHRPLLAGRFLEMYYPKRNYDIPLQIKNMQTGSIAVYRMPNDFEFGNEETSGTRFEQIQRNGTIIETLPINIDNASLLETKHDTLRWHTPDFGQYALVLTGTTKEKTDKYEPKTILTRVSALTFMSVAMPDGKERIMVTDAMTGKPQQGVKATFYRKDKQDYTLIAERTTDSRGIAELHVGQKDVVYVELSRGEDTAHKKESLGWRSTQRIDDKTNLRFNLYTDRSIYRPGQMVYVGVIAHTQSHDRPPRVEAGTECKLIFIDANNQKIAEHTLKTDSFGTLKDSLQLPESGLPGRYSIRINNYYHEFLVEEFRRPTFHVEIDEAPAITLPIDSITLTGRAMTYSQWPVGNARVTGTYQWQQSWWFKRVVPSERHKIDTLFTDEEGRFSITVPVSKTLTKEQLQWGQTLSLNVDVLNLEGETQQGNTRLTLCSTPLRMQGNVPEQENRESLKPWRFNLFASNDKAVEGNVLCILSKNGKEVERFCVPSGKDTIPETLRTLPSGKYDLYAKAEIKGDTASYKAGFTIFSITDTQLQGKHDLWLYTPCDTISHEKPARFQVGTTLLDAWIYCIMTGECGLVRDTVLHLSNSAMLIEVPYEERFRHHLSVTLMMMYEGNFRQEIIDFKLEQPDTQLRMHWDTFRNYLQPGQKEQWRLTLKHPDGSPALANVMVGMYDASLDVLSPYDMNLLVDRTCRRNVLPRVNAFELFARKLYWEVNLLLRFLPYDAYDFGRWNDEFFRSAIMSRGGKTMRLRGARTEGVAMNSFAAPMAKTMVATGAILFDRSAGQVEEESANSGVVEDDALSETPTAAGLRSDLSETAFFYPQLRTDSKGQTSIEFTLPEGLTSWHLHGLAHTKDMMTAEWQETVVAKKELMAELSLPRFLRNGDEATLTASIRNASEKCQKGEAILEVIDASDDKRIKTMKVRFELEPSKEAVYRMTFDASTAYPLLAVRWKAMSMDASDGEMRYLPVLSDMQSVTETRTYVLEGDTTLSVDLSALFANGNPKAANKTLTVEHITAPLSLALQTLPSLSAPTRSDVLSVASAYYGGALAYHIAHTYPEVRTYVEEQGAKGKEMEWKSPLMRNLQLADILLDETPWMLDAQRQKTNWQRLSSLFAEVEQERHRIVLLSALSVRQHEDGSFGWFPGMRGSLGMTLEVATLLARLGKIKGELSTLEAEILDGAMAFLEKEMHKEVEQLRKAKNPVLSLAELRYLYIYIMYWKTLDDDARYMVSLLRRQADNLDREPRALAAIVLQSVGEAKKAQALMPRIHELLRHQDGLYLAYPGGNFVSIDRKVETHVNLMEAVRTVEPKETALLAGMTEWLIRQKRTLAWEHPVQSADAVYALMQSPFSSSEGRWEGRVAYDKQVRSLQLPESSADYVREVLEPVTDAKELHIVQQSTSPLKGEDEALLSWGAVYAQYQLPAAEAENHREGMTVRREVGGKDELRAGDRVRVRYTITTDRDYEYVSLRAPRPAVAEPAQQLSGYRWQNGLGYYQAMHDASTEYFIDRLPQGTYVIEEEWLMNGNGTYLLPSARLSSLYAPEFQSQTAGERIEVK